MTMHSRKEIHPVLLTVLSSWEGTPRAKDVVAEVTRQFPQLTTADLSKVNKDGGSTWRNRVHWARQDLVMQGLIDKSVRSVWPLTDKGVSKAMGAYPQIEPSALDVHDEAVPPPSDDSQPEPVSVILSEREALVEELLAAAADSADSNRLERAVADAMRYFGFDVDEIGGPGQTDVLAVAPLGPLRYRVVLDAKSTASKRVMESQINWLAIEQHRKTEQAEHAAIVGIDFAGGQLRQHAEEFGVCLLTVGELAELIQLHADQPLSHVVLRSVFASSPRASASLPEVRGSAADAKRRIRLLLFVLEQIDHFNTVAPDDVIVKPETLWATTLNIDELQGVTQLDVANALHLLEIIGAIGKSNGDGYVSQTSKAGAVAMLHSLGNASRLETEEDMPGEDTKEVKPQIA